MVIRRLHDATAGERAAIDLAGVIVCTGLAGVTLVLLLAAARAIL